MNLTFDVQENVEDSAVLRLTLLPLGILITDTLEEVLSLREGARVLAKLFL